MIWSPKEFFGRKWRLGDRIFPALQTTANLCAAWPQLQRRRGLTEKICTILSVALVTYRHKADQLSCFRLNSNPPHTPHAPPLVRHPLSGQWIVEAVWEVRQKTVPF